MELKEEDLIPCEDFSYFEARLTALRKSDDLISIELNKIDVNSQAECGNIWRKLAAGAPGHCPLPFPSLPLRPGRRIASLAAIPLPFLEMAGSSCIMKMPLRWHSQHRTYTVAVHV
jgi:hypothetical protein